MKFEIKARPVDAWAFYTILPFSKLLTCNLPPDANGLVDAKFESSIEVEELIKLFHRVENGPAMMESLKINL
ncbi:MAG: hypothetical protein ACHQNT_06620 [Bacteroidia bacterium]